MDESLIVFRENGYHFGILPHEFDRNILLDQAVVSPVKNIPALWQFDSQANSLKGCFIQLGCMVGTKHSELNHKGYLFLKEYDSKRYWGVFLNDIYLQLPMKKIEDKLKSLENYGKISDSCSNNVFHSVFRYRRKNIWIIYPQGVFQKYAATIRGIY